MLDRDEEEEEGGETRLEQKRKGCVMVVTSRPGLFPSSATSNERVYDVGLGSPTWTVTASTHRPGRLASWASLRGAETHRVFHTQQHGKGVLAGRGGVCAPGSGLCAGAVAEEDEGETAPPTPPGGHRDSLGVSGQRGPAQRLGDREFLLRFVASERLCNTVLKVGPSTHWLA